MPTKPAQQPVITGLTGKGCSGLFCQEGGGGGIRHQWRAPTVFLPLSPYWRTVARWCFLSIRAFPIHEKGLLLAHSCLSDWFWLRKYGFESLWACCKRSRLARSPRGGISGTITEHLPLGLQQDFSLQPLHASERNAQSMLHECSLFWWDQFAVGSSLLFQPWWRPSFGSVYSAEITWPYFSLL